MKQYHSRRMNSTVWNYFTRLMMCTPESVQTAALNSPTDRANDASSNGFCIWPRPNDPRSPPRFAELQSLNSAAMSSKLRSPATICCRYSARTRQPCCTVFLSSLQNQLLNSLKHAVLLCKHGLCRHTCVCPSVYPSVTCVNSVKMSNRIFKIFLTIR